MNVVFDAGASRRIQPVVSTTTESVQGLAMVEPAPRLHAANASAARTVKAAIRLCVGAIEGKGVTNAVDDKFSAYDANQFRSNVGSWLSAVPTATPEPATVVLLASGLVVVGAPAESRRRAQ